MPTPNSEHKTVARFPRYANIGSLGIVLLVLQQAARLVPGLPTFGLFITPSSQEMESPANPGRFTNTPGIATGRLYPVKNSSSDPGLIRMRLPKTAPSTTRSSLTTCLITRCGNLSLAMLRPRMPFSTNFNISTLTPTGIPMLVSECKNANWDETITLQLEFL